MGQISNVIKVGKRIMYKFYNDNTEAEQSLRKRIFALRNDLNEAQDLYTNLLNDKLTEELTRKASPALNDAYEKYQMLLQLHKGDK